MRSTYFIVIIATGVIVVGDTRQSQADSTNPIYETYQKIPPRKRVTSGEKNTGRNHIDWLIRNTCPSIMKKKANPADVKESDYQDLKTRLYLSRHLYPTALDELNSQKYFQGLLKRVNATSAEDYLKQCTQVAYAYASGKNAKGRPLSDVCLGDRFPVWINLNLIEENYNAWKKWKETGNGRRPLVSRQRQQLEWARRAMNINKWVAHDEALDLEVFSGKPDETTLRQLLDPSYGAKRCDTNDEFKDAFKEIDPKRADSIFTKREKEVLEMEKHAGVKYVGVRVWYAGRKKELADKRNKILYRLLKDTQLRGQLLKAGTLLEVHSDKF